MSVCIEIIKTCKNREQERGNSYLIVRWRWIDMLHISFFCCQEKDKITFNVPTNFAFDILV